MQGLRKLARYIKGTLHYKIEAYTDADGAGQSDRHSITGGLLVLDGANVSLLGHGHRKRLQLPAENQSSML